MVNKDWVLWTLQFAALVVLAFVGASALNALVAHWLGSTPKE